MLYWEINVVYCAIQNIYTLHIQELGRFEVKTARFCALTYPNSVPCSPSSPSHSCIRSAWWAATHKTSAFKVLQQRDKGNGAQIQSLPHYQPVTTMYVILVE